jgi:uncharacterized protein YjbI with pentapeptide repeats
MKVINDTPLALGWIAGKIAPPQLTATFILKGTFALQSSKASEWAEDARPLSGDIYADDDPTKGLIYPSDFAPLKPRADVMVLGTAWAPGGKPAPTVPVSFQVGPLVKGLTVFGERRWRPGAGDAIAATDPSPFVSLPLTFQHAFGGPGYLKNPLGRGRESDVAPLIEDRHRPSAGPSDDREPAGFGPIPAGWAQRTALRGTYDDPWLKSRWPWFPTDFDWGYFNAAPRDQQVDGYLAGDEQLAFQHLHPEIPVYQTRLPAVRPRCLVTDRTFRGEQRLRDVPLNLDTLWADTTSGILVLVWRGHLDVQTLKLKEIEQIAVVVEPLAMQPHPAAHYRDLVPASALEEELPEPAVGLLDIPGGAEFSFASIEPQMAALERDFALLEAEMTQSLAEAEAELAKKKAELIAQGVDPQLFNRTQASSAVDVLDDAVAKMRPINPAEALKVESHRSWIAGAESDLAAMDGEMAQMKQEMDALSSAMAADRPKPCTRETVQEAIATGQGAPGQNLSELDLSNLRLERFNFRGALMSKVNLSGSRLNGADLRDADLTGADLSGAILDGSDLAGADLTGATLAGATFAGISLIGAVLAGLDLAGADLTGCAAERANFAAANLAGAKLDRANLVQADFTGANLAGARLVGATLRSAQLDGAKAHGIVCYEADLTGVHGSGGCDFSSGDFRRARGEGAIFDEANLDQADFSNATLARALFSDASLRGARFDRADLREAKFDDAILREASFNGANLLRAALDRADLTDAQCQGANFFEAGFWDAVAERADFRHANLTSTLLDN